MGIPPEELDRLARAADAAEATVAGGESPSSRALAATRVDVAPRSERILPSDDDLATVREVLNFMGVVSSPDVDLIQRLLTAASLFFVQAIEQPVKAGPRQLVTNGGKPRVILPLGPVVSVQSVTCNGAPIDAASLGGTDSGWLWEPRTATVTFRSVIPTAGTLNLVVNYTSGYDPVPPQVHQAVCEMVSTRMQERKAIGIASRSLGGESVSFAREALPPFTADLVNRMRRVVPA